MELIILTMPISENPVTWIGITILLLILLGFTMGVAMKVNQNTVDIEDATKYLKRLADKLAPEELEDQDTNSK